MQILHSFFNTYIEHIFPYVYPADMKGGKEIEKSKWIRLRMQIVR